MTIRKNDISQLPASYFLSFFFVREILLFKGFVVLKGKSFKNIRRKKIRINEDYKKENP